MASDIDTAKAQIAAAGYRGLNAERMLLAALKAAHADKQQQLEHLKTWMAAQDRELTELTAEVDSLNEQIEKETASDSNSN